MRLRAAFYGLTILWVLNGGLLADETAKNWMNFFEGKWERKTEFSFTSDGKTEKKSEEIEWKGELHAGGTMLIGKGTSETFGDWTFLMAVDGYTGNFFEYGGGASGNSYRLVFDKFSATELSGELVGTLPDGEKGTGKLTIRRTGDDSYVTEVEFAGTKGTVLKGGTSNKRK